MSANPEQMLIEIRRRGVGELMADLDERSCVLAYASLVRVFTAGQACRLLRDASPERCEGLLYELLYSDRWIGRLDEIRMPKSCGGGMVDVYYLTQRGAEALKETAPEIHKHARPGQPRGVLRSRIPHELLVAEAYLWLAAENQILAFWPETELKSQIGKERVREAGRKLDRLPDEATGDFKVLLADQKGSRWVECEIAVHYERKQVAAKPHKMLWFTSDRRQADLIESIKGSRPVMLGDVSSPYAAAVVEASDKFKGKTRAKPRNRNDLKDRIMKALDRLHGGGTAPAVSGILRVKRPNVSHCLSRLASEGRVTREEAHLRPGIDRGRPTAIYVKAGIAAESIHVKARYLMISHVVIAVGTKDYRVESCDLEKGQIEFRHRRNRDANPLLFLIDEPVLPVDRVAERVRLAETRHAGSKTVVAAVAADPERIAALNSRAKSSRIVDVCKLREAIQKERMN